MTKTLFDALLPQEAKKRAVWNKGFLILGRFPDEWRKDEFGNEIAYSAYGRRDSAYGWEFDHIRPDALGGGDHIANLRPLHWKVNASRGPS